MPKTALEQWDETNSNNSDIGGTNIAEGCAPSGINNAIREEMAQVAAWLGDDTLASAATTDLGSVPGRYVSITGTTTITGFGTIKAGTIKFLKFAGALTLTHNATSLILYGANIPTAAGDTAMFVSEGSGNWRCLGYQYAAGWRRISPVVVSGSPAAAITFTNLSTYRAIRGSGFLLPATDGTGLRFQASADNGSSWLDGVQNDAVAHRASSTADTYDSDLAGPSIALGGNTIGIGMVSAGEGISIKFEITELNQARNTRIVSLNEYRSASGVLVSERIAGQVLNSSPHDAIRFMPGSGNFQVGSWVELEGLAF